MLLNCGVGEDSWEALGLQGDQTSPILKKINPEYPVEGLMLRLKLQYFGHLMEGQSSWLIGKDPDVGKDWGQEEKGATEDKMVRWHHWLNAHEFNQTPRDSEGQGSLACCSPWGWKSWTWQWLNHLFVGLLCLLFLIPRDNFAQALYIFFILWRTFSVFGYINLKKMKAISFQCLCLYLSVLSCISCISALLYQLAIAV